MVCFNHSIIAGNTLFENYSKCRIWIFEFWHFPPIFALLKVTCLVTLFDRKLRIFKNSPKWTIFGLLKVTCLVTLFDHKLQFFKNSPKWTIFGIFNYLLSTQNVNVARNVE